MSAADIADALLARAATLSVGSPALPIAMPEMGFDPKVSATDGKYLEVLIFFNRHAWVGLSAGALKQGLLQVTVVWPPREGTVDAAAAAQEVIDHFKGQTMRSGSVTVKVTEEPSPSGPLTDDSELRVPVTIVWTAS